MGHRCHASRHALTPSLSVSWLCFEKAQCLILIQTSKFIKHISRLAQELERVDLDYLPSARMNVNVAFWYKEEVLSKHAKIQDSFNWSRFCIFLCSMLITGPLYYPIIRLRAYAASSMDT
eukprot:scaffold16276_cov49-Cyclotella_meneghiniana.AAC.7